MTSVIERLAVGNRPNGAPWHTAKTIGQMLDGLDKKHTYVAFFEVDDNLDACVAAILTWADALRETWAQDQDEV